MKKLKEKNLTKSEIEQIQLVETTFMMGFVMWGLIMIVTAKDANDYGILPIVVAVICAGIPYICLRLLPSRSKLLQSKVYQGSLEELVTESEEVGYLLKEKIGELYIFSTRYYFVSQFRFYVQDKGENCKLFGLYPKDLVKLELEEKAKAGDG